MAEHDDRFDASRQLRADVADELENSQVYDKDADNRPHAAPRSASWQSTTTLIIADVVGVGVLSLPAAFAQFGWAGGLPLLAACWPLNFFTGYLLNKVHLAFPRFGTFGDAGEKLAGRLGSYVGYGSLYLYLMMLLGNYFIVLSQGLQGIFWNWEICRPAAGLIVMLLLMPTAQMRTLSGLSGMSVVSFSCMAVVCALCVYSIGTKPEGTPCFPTPLAPADGVMGASKVLAKFVFGFSGQKIFLEMQAEMKSPEHFTRSMHVAYPCLVFAYGALCVGVFSICGDSTPGYLLDVMGYDWLRSVTNAMLFVPITVSYTISQQVLSRAIARRFLPRALEDGFAGRASWFVLTVACMVFGWALSNSIPLFADFVSLMGALLSTQMTFSLPCLLYLGVRRLGKLPPMSAALDRAILATVVCIMVVSCCLTVTGTIAAVEGIIDDAGGIAPPFGCICTAITC